MEVPLAKPKNPENQTTAEILQSKLDEARARRLAAHIAKKPEISEMDAREAFHKYWMTAKKEFNRPKELEEVLWIHAKAIGFTKPEQFEASVRHFGLKKVGEK